MDRKNEVPAPAGRGRATWWGWLIWLPVCVALGLLFAWASVALSTRFSPLLVFPLMVGLVLGASLVSLARICQVGHRATVWTALLLSVAAVVIGQHWFSYRAARVMAEQDLLQYQKAQQAFGELVAGRLPAAPSSMREYLTRQADHGRRLETTFGSWTARGPAAWLSWVLDGLLILLPAAVMTWMALRRPFCGQCRSWYATRRSGPVDAETARRLIDVLEWPAENAAGVTHFRLISCNGGCGTTGLALSCKGRAAANLPAVTWLDDQRRNTVVAVLDNATAAHEP